MNIILAEHAINNTVNNQNVKLKKKKNDKRAKQEQYLAIYLYHIVLRCYQI